MSKVQLYAVNTGGETVLLTLSDSSPMKLNLSVASLNAFNPTSYYSQTFRVPGQGLNGQFFKDVFSVNGYSFDASKTAQAWINNNGFLFSIGNLNLKSVFINERLNSIEYEVFFMGDTSDFASAVGSGYMNTIDTTELNHLLTYDNVTTSWGATAGATAGLLDGNVLYPLCEWGYLYGSNNFPIQTTISTGFPKGSTAGFPKGGSFTLGPTSGLSLTQFKPAVRVKWLWDHIFEEAGYKFSSEFIDSNFFDAMYMVSDGQAQTAQLELPALCKVTASARINLTQGQTARILYNTTLVNPSLAFNTTTSEYVAPVPGVYSFIVSGFVFGPGPQAGLYRVDLVSDIQGIIQTSGSKVAATPSPTPAAAITLLPLASFTLVAGEKLSVNITCLPGSLSGISSLFNVFECKGLQSSLEVLCNSFFPGEGQLTKLDFIKGISKAFNLIFVPGRDQAKTFEIYPWVDWIQLGDVKDWTEYLDGSADTEQHAPFLDQPRVQIFTATDDADYQNLSYQQQFKFNYMYYEEDSEINLIKGKSETKLPFAPTPLVSMPAKGEQFPDWVFPSLGKLLPGDSETDKAGKIQPIQPKPRILFYNGLQDNPIDWFLDTSLLPGATGLAQSQYPLVSQYETFPPSDFTFDLTFQSKRALWSEASSYNGQTGQDLYTEYWEDYIDWLYDPFNRIKNVTMRLDPYLIEDLRFNDRIWVKDCWFFVNKITDYPVGERALVKVELIKVPDKAIPNIQTGATGPAVGECQSVSLCNNNALDFPALTNSWTYVDCFNNLQTITVEPQTCVSICFLFPNALFPLPSGWTALPNGNCEGITPTPSGEFIFIDMGVSGLDGINATLLIEGASGGPTGTYLPMQYITLNGPDEIPGIFLNIPFDYGLRNTLTWNNGVTGTSFVEGSFIFMVENSVLVASDTYSGFYAGPISAQLPTGITAANYQIEVFLKGIIPDSIWSTEEALWNDAEVVWNV